MNPSKPVAPKTIARWVLPVGLERHLLRAGKPRLQMLLLVGVALAHRRAWEELVEVALVLAAALSILLVRGIFFRDRLRTRFHAEVFLDGVLTPALYRRLSRIEHRHWLKSAFARTRAPFLWTLLFLICAGGEARQYAPEAISIGGVVRNMAGPGR
jgi:phosphotransferase system  glucose/maltose/N-acetylglucosamine-specific IIC component